MSLSTWTRRTWFFESCTACSRRGGLVFIGVPTIPPVAALWHLPVVSPYFGGHLHSDQINAFTPATLRFTCERAGFEAIEFMPFYPPPFSVFNKILRPFVGIVFVGRKVDAREYPEKAGRRRRRQRKGLRLYGTGFSGMGMYRRRIDLPGLCAGPPGSG